MALPDQATDGDSERSRSPIDSTRLGLALENRKFHHNSIWEEQKHFTWLISILLSGVVLGLASDRINVTGKGALILVGSAVGLLLSLMAFRVQRREGVYYRIAQATFVEEWNALFPRHPFLPPAERANLGIARLLWLSVTGRAGVRDYFQSLFLSFAIAFLGLASYQLWREWPTLVTWFRALRG